MAEMFYHAISGLQISVCIENYFLYFSSKTYVVGTQKNRLKEHPKHIFKLMGKKIIKILRK